MPSEPSGGLDGLSTRVRERLTAIHGRPTGGWNDDDTDELREVALGKRGVTRGFRVRALVELGRLAPEGVVEEVLRPVVENEQEPPEFRRAAAVALRGLPPAAAERVSIEFLDSDDDGVRATAAGTLGRVGGAEALEALEPLVDPDAGTLGRPETFRDSVSRTAAFSHAVLAHHLRRPDAPRFDVVGVDRDDLSEGTRFGSAPLTSDEREGLPEATFGVSLATDRATVFADDGTKRRPVVVPAADVADDPATELRERPALFAVVLDFADELETYEPSLLGFCAPADDEVRVTFCRPGGRAMYAGWGTVRDGTVHVRLTDTGLLGTAPTRMRLAFDEDGLHVSEGVTDSTKRQVRRPEPLSE